MDELKTAKTKAEVIRTVAAVFNVLISLTTLAFVLYFNFR